ncbi:SET domain-containing protein [Leucogyrophana mollusca]|uniref:SET domain-containing protein n=1 Tax=Leucogyrophana mollusca TaxID=85980 RepID=A0ACB8B026_9AGAM|nr:SET domain-containing protein [Leucogyrophana mollusca]
MASNRNRWRGNRSRRKYIVRSTRCVFKFVFGLYQFLQVRWGQWHREDGTNTTWHSDIADRPDLVRAWKRSQQRKREDIASKDLDIQIAWDPDETIPVHDRPSELRAQAYDEKLRNAQPELTSEMWDAELDIALGRAEPVDEENRAPRLRARPRQDSAVVEAPSRSRSLLSASSAVRSLGKDRRAPLSAPSPSMRGKSLSKAASSSSYRSTPSKTPDFSVRSSSSMSLSGSPGPSNRMSQSTVSQPSRLLSPRNLLQKRWGQATKSALAASVKIVNDLDDEEIPSHMNRFRYTEQKYMLGDELRHLASLDEGIFLTCECSSNCQDATRCHCQIPSEIKDGIGRKIFAYSRGLFTFRVPRGVEVIECNAFCGCDPACNNRVAQRPRDIGIEVFKTRHCGWGARAIESIPKGKVMGLFTGQLVRRDQIEDLPESHAGYIFDLDGTEAKGEVNSGEKFSVDSFECGNWTRFVNHSCDPNMKVYSVVYDTVPDMNAPYLAFVAVKPIPARTELTIDYDPCADVDAAGPGKSKVPRNARPCRCESVRCRGWVKV